MKEGKTKSNIKKYPFGIKRQAPPPPPPTNKKND